jgi:hypothetical protein
MKFLVRCPQLKRSWLVLGGTIVLGLAATALNNNTSQDQLAQFDVQVRAACRMVSAAVARKDLVRSAKNSPTVFVQRDLLCLWSLLTAAAVANMSLVTIRSSVLRARSRHQTRTARRPTRTGAAP